MTTFHLQIETQSPVLLADGPPAGNLTSTLDHIPGAVVLGMLAHRYIAMNGAVDETFQKIFLKGGAVFDHAFIDGALPIPLSARTCKYFDGFYAPSEAHGVVDLLLANDQEIRCPAPDEGCGHPTDYFEGYYRPNGNGTWKQAKVKRRVITRTAIEAAFGTAATGKLYSHEVIEEQQIFKTQITVTDAGLAAAIAKLLEKPPFKACIGKARSRGMGWVAVAPCGPFQPELKSAVPQRAPLFKDKDGNPLLVVTLLSDALFSDDYLRDLTLPNINHLDGIKDITPSEWETEVAKAFADTRLVAGFQGAPWNLPREPRLAVCAGSVVSFRWRGTGTPSYPQGDGLIRIGERTAEGYGRALLWAPFHGEFRPKQEVTP